MMLEAPASSIIGMTLLVSFAALLMTVLLTPLVMARFRARVSRSMNTSALGDAEHDAPPLSAAGGEVPAAVPKDAIAMARARRIRLAGVFALAGLAHAVATSVIFLVTMGGTEALANTAFHPAVFAAFALPVLPTVMHGLGWGPWRVAGGTLLGFLAGLLQPAGGLYLAIAQLHLLVPTVAFLVFSLRFWRAVAPLMLLISALAAFGWLAGLALARPLLSDAPSWVWAARLVGLAGGLVLGLTLLRLVGMLYARKRMSDQDLFIDGWWAIFSMIQAVIFTVRTEDPLMLGSAATFAVYWATRRCLMPFAAADSARRPTPLLLLRVFGHERRTEQLFDAVTTIWRAIGPVYLIAGRDLAFRHVTPAEFYGFLSGKLSRSFVKDAGDLAHRLATIDDAPDPDGRYRVNHVFCHADTWQPVLDALMRRSAAVALDLRGFSAGRQGVAYELERIGAYAGARPVALILDRTTDRRLAETIIECNRRGTGASRISWIDGERVRQSALAARIVERLRGPSDEDRAP